MPQRIVDSDCGAEAVSQQRYPIEPEDLAQRVYIVAHLLNRSHALMRTCAQHVRTTVEVAQLCIPTEVRQHGMEVLMRQACAAVNDYHNLVAVALSLVDQIEPV